MIEMAVALIFFIVFPMLMSENHTKDRLTETDPVVHRTNGELKTEYLLDCKEKQLCLQNCSSRRIFFSYTRQQNFKPQCLRDCSKIICIDPNK